MITDLIILLFEVFLAFLVPIIIIVDIIFGFIVVFVERKSPHATMAWLMILFFIPILGVILYIFFGQSFYHDRMFEDLGETERRIKEFLTWQKNDLDSEDSPVYQHMPHRYKGLVRMIMDDDGSPITVNNAVKIYSDGNEKYKDLIEDIYAAKDSVHMEYYILKDDEIGREVFKALTQKACEGVEVRFLGDALGCAGPRRSFFKPLLDAGGKVAFFFPSLIRLNHPRINYRNHRKIAVIDGKIGFIGGYNIGDDYLSRIPKWAPWRDAAVRVTGDCVYSLQSRFLRDWNYATRKNADYNLLSYTNEELERYFPKISERVDTYMNNKEGGADTAGDNAMDTNAANESVRSDIAGVPAQIVSGGPDTYWNPIKDMYAKMISLATESIYIQTPYFVPDQTILESLRMAALSGVDVKIMFPCKPDHIFVYWAGYSYLEQLFDAGVRVFVWKEGFIHAKTIVVDDKCGSIGSANWDIRSFKLNFESNIIMYDENAAKTMKDLFIKDLEFCEELTREKIDALPLIKRIKLSISRIFSPVL